MNYERIRSDTPNVILVLCSTEGARSEPFELRHEPWGSWKKRRSDSSIPRSAHIPLPSFQGFGVTIESFCLLLFAF